MVTEGAGFNRFRFANLSLPPDWVTIGAGDLTSERVEWVQRLDRWSAIYYQHDNVVGLDGAEIPVTAGTILIFAPGVRGSHAKTREGTQHHFITYNLPGKVAHTAAIPLLNPGMERVFPDLVRAMERIGDDKRPALAFAWNLMWSIARNPGVVRSRKELYVAEEWIFSNLGEKITVPEIAQVAGVSPRHLLNSFQREHGTTVQEFVRRKRVQEAVRLLTTSRLPIKAVASRVGIPDLQLFSKTIRLYTGCSPRAFRKISQEQAS